MMMIEGSCKRSRLVLTGACIGAVGRIVFGWTGEANCPRLESSENGSTKKARRKSIAAKTYKR